MAVSIMASTLLGSRLLPRSERSFLGAPKRARRRGALVWIPFARSPRNWFPTRIAHPPRVIIDAWQYVFYWLERYVLSIDQ
jgi:hypothetical protein